MNDCIQKEKIEEFNKGQIKKLRKLVDDLESKKLIALDLFSGCGGLSLGFEEAGFRVLVAIDNDYAACETYSYNFKDSCVLCLDLTESDANPYFLKKQLGVNKEKCVWTRGKKKELRAPTFGWGGSLRWLKLYHGDLRRGEEPHRRPPSSRAPAHIDV